MNPKSLSLPILLAVLYIGTPLAFSATFQVTVTNDAGAGSLRQAILDANATAGPDTIAFTIAAGGLTIFPASALPVIADAVTIDGSTQPGFAGAPLIELAGASAGAAANGLHISAGSSVVRGLAINRFTASGLRLSTNGNNVVEGCYIGTGLGGTNDLGNAADGIVITTNSANNVIGGTTLAARNVISGNNQNGVHIIGPGATNNAILGNVIGLGLNNTDLGNTGDGVRLVAPRNRVGGPAAVERNVISGNNSDGIEVVGTNAPSCVIQGNFLGTDTSGTIARGNGAYGVLVSGAPGTLIGGATAGAGNLISGNGAGVELNGLTAAFNLVLGNLIGTDASGVNALGNPAGVIVTANARTNTIGGVAAGEANTIAFNRDDGVYVVTGTNNVIRGNRIFANGQLGIDLGANGVQTNDANDADTGANQLQNYPLLTAATGGVGSVQITGTLNSRASTTYLIDFYANYACDPSTNGEGQQYLGSTSVSTDAGGNAAISATVPATLTGRFISATATDPDGNTSEFSPCVQATVTVPGSTFVVVNTNNAGPGSLRQAILDANAAINAGDTISFNIPGAGVQIISPTNTLPLITDPVTIDGYTQPGSAANSSSSAFNGLPLIRLDGALAGAGVDGLRITAGDSTIRGLVITRFTSDAIEIVTNGNNVVEGCLLGIDTTNTNRPNAAAGVHIITTAGNRIGGSTAGARNVISGNSGTGIHIENAGASNNVVLGNLIGPDLTGAIDRGNTGDGVLLDDAPNNVVGGATAAERNVISANNGDGIEITAVSASGNSVFGNFIGTDASGALPLANGAAGVNVSASARNNLIGSTAAGRGNRIAFNVGDGVFMGTGTNNAIRGNAIFANSTVVAGLGIDLGANGVTANDANDADAGANQLQNFPVLTSATANVGNVQISGVLTSAPSTTFQIDFYVSAACDLAGNGEGELYLGSAAASTDAGGIAAISATLPVTLTNRYITATATDPFGNTSEFGPCLRTGSTIPATTFTVVNTNDSGPGSLRDAIARHNNTANATPNTIAFNIPGGSVQTIRPLSALPPISEPARVDGLTQPGATANSSPNAFNAGLLIRLVGANAGAGVDGLRFTASTNTVRGLVIINFTGDGLEFLAGTMGNRVEGCAIGIDLDGSDQGNAGNGILLTGSGNNLIGGTAPAARNAISGNTGDAIEINGTNATGNIVAGNLIGTDLTGTLDRGNDGSGVLVVDAPGNTIGGASGGSRNVIAGNGDFGVQVAGALSVANVIQGNYIGLDAGGGAALGNTQTGVYLSSGANNTIVGGATAAERNVISANEYGIYVQTVGSAANRILGNFIGTDAGGTLDRGNVFTGVVLDNAPNNLVGGPTAGERNVISGNNHHGLYIFGVSSTNNVALGNFIGTDHSGTGVLGNGIYGVFIGTSARGNRIGSVGASEGNLVAHQLNDGVHVAAGTNNAVRGNRIFNNGGLGIDLAPDGVTANDVNDVDGGPNQLQNFPVLTTATISASSVTIAGTLNSVANTTFQIDFFANPACDTAGHGEGEFLLGSTSVTTDAGGLASISATFPFALTSRYLSATATDPFGNTSEFGPCLRAGSTLPATTFTVVNTNDSGPGSLREVILQHNVTASGTPNTIAFNIPGGGVQTIRPLSALPIITEPAFIDGLTQPGATANSSPNAFNAGLLVRLVGTSAGAGADGLRFFVSTNTVRGLVIINFPGDGLEFLTGTMGNRVEGCVIGLDLDGSDQGNVGNGIALTGSGNNVIGGTTPAARNVISGNTGDAIEINGTNATGNVVAGNLIGTDLTGTLDRGNNGNGVFVTDAPGNTIGGTSDAARNVISGNAGYGIRIAGALSTANVVQGNFIGLDAGGGVALGNSATGVYLSGGANHTIVGGSAAGARNVISANDYGIYIHNPGSTTNRVQGNFIGTDAGGTIDRGNANSGVALDNASGNIIGGAAPGERNVISGNGDYGVGIGGPSASNNLVYGNLIGSDVSGTLALPNSVYGVYFSFTPRGNRIGGPGEGQGNLIAWHPNDGVHVASGTNNTIRGNLIFNNGGLGIDLAPDGVTTNDVNDADGGANLLQNFPVLTGATNAAASVTIAGTLNGAANTTFELDFYATVVRDPSGHGEGEQYLGSATVTTAGTGNGTFLVTLPTTARGRHISATATDPFGNTSEFSAGIAAASLVAPTNLVVTTTADSGPGSLREAITLANSFISSGNDIISFNIPGVGPHTIAPASALPRLLDPVTIDGYTQPGAGANSLASGNNAVLKIIINGANAPANTDGLELFAGGCVVRGLSIVGFSGATGDGIVITGGTGSRVEGCFIGLEPDGSTRRGNAGYGVHITPFSAQIDTSSHTIGGTTPAARNVISANYQGIYVNASATNAIAGNFVGTDVTGRLARGNTNGGVQVIGAKSTGNQVGGPTAAHRNVISGNGGLSFSTSAGVALDTCVGTVVAANFIGVDATGTNALGNAQAGLRLRNATTNLIGGLTLASANVISGNAAIGVVINAGSAFGNRIQGNLIGTDASGTRALGNAAEGIDVQGSADNVVGGPEPGAGNVIAGNGAEGIEIFSTSAIGVLVQGNFIGTDRSGTLALGNVGSGVQLDSSRNRVEGNVLAFNRVAGVWVTGGVGNTVTANSIHSNTNLGIDLSSFGADLNDPGDLDGGVNGMQNYPVLTEALSTASSTVVAGTLNSVASRSFRIEFFNNTACDSVTFGNLNGYGEGRTYLGFLDVNTDAAGNAAFTFVHPSPIAFGHYITATATDTNGSTSEFSQCVKVIPVNSVDLAVTIGDFADPTPLASNLVYSVTVQNNGPTNATSVVVTDRLPAGVNFISAVATQGTCSHAAGLVTCNLGGIVRVGTAGVTITVRPTEFGRLSNFVSVASAQFDHTPENNTDIEFTQAGLADTVIAVSANPDPVVAGQTLTFTVTAINLGPDPAPAAFVSFSVDDAFCIQSTALSQGTLTGGGNFFNGLLGVLPVNGSATLTVTGVAGLDGPLFSGASTGGGVSDPNSNNNATDNTTTVLPGAGLLRFETPNFTERETNGLAVIRVIRTGGSSGTLTAQYTTTNGTALAGSDYTARTGTLTFGPGVLSQQFTVPLNNDALSECNETLGLRLFNGTGGGGTVLCADIEATLTITDDDGVYSGAVLLVSVNTNQPPESGSGYSGVPTISADGRFVAFESSADDLVPGDNNFNTDVFVRDLQAGTTRLISRDQMIFSGYTPLISGNGSNIVFSTSFSEIGEELFVHIGALSTNQAVTVTPGGGLSSDGGTEPTISSNGFVITFTSFATDLVTLPDNNGNQDVFVRDLSTQTTALVSVNQAGTAAGNGQSYNGRVSADGRYVAFLSSASDLVSGDTNNAPDVFLRDLQTGTTILVSRRNTGGGSGNSGNDEPAINADGRYVAFTSYARDLVANDNTFSRDVYLFDRVAGTNRLVSVNRFGTGPGIGDSYAPSISANGRHIAFESQATNLVANDLNGELTDVFVRDVVAGTTTLASLDCAGAVSGNDTSFAPAIAGDGRSVAFLSRASDLTSGEFGDFDGGEETIVAAAGGAHIQLFRRDLTTNRTELLSRNLVLTGGADGDSYAHAISFRGTAVAFASYATDLVNNDNNFTGDVFTWSSSATPPVPMPTLTITRVNANQVTLSWPSPSTGFNLESTGNLNSPIVWSPVNATVTDNGLLKSVTLFIDLNTEARFFRLRK